LDGQINASKPSPGQAGVFVAEGSVARDQLKAFLVRMQDDAALKQQVLAAATADDVAQIALKLGFEFSGDELLRASGQRFDRVTVRKNDIPGEYN
jgi:predicted ribosomally synthesized peptide with nif11-like leader